MKIFHTETQADYDALMIELEGKGCKWNNGDKMTEAPNYWIRHKSETCVMMDWESVTYSPKVYLKLLYQNTPITKYKAKVDEKMKFTKENVLAEFKKCRDTSDGSTSGFYTAISKLDDTPKKVVVPKFVAEWIENCKEKANLIDCLQGSYHHYNGSEIIKEDEDWLFEGNNQDVVARAWLDGYEVEKEPLFCVNINGQFLVKMIAERNVHKFVEEVKLCVWDTQAYQLTEQEIKAIDERYIPFMIPVDEVNND